MAGQFGCVPGHDPLEMPVDFDQIAERAETILLDEGFTYGKEGD